MRKLALITLSAITLAGGAALAADLAPGARTTYFKNVGYQAKKMGELAKSFDPAAARAQAAELQVLLDTDFATLFPAGTSAQEMPNDNRASPKIWTDFDGFTEKVTGFKSAGAALVAAADAGDQRAFGQAMGQFGASCKACHDDYRLPR